MKKRILVIICSILSVCYAYAIDREPFWVTQHPPALDTYIGIASAPISNPDYRNAARISALNDIAAQISVNIESESFMRSLDVNGVVQEIFDIKIKESLAAYIEGYEMVDSYQSDTHYYVYYRLDKDVYDAYITKKRQEITLLGLDYLTKGKTEERSGNLMLAMSIYAKGLCEVEPYLNLSLNGLYGGEYIDVASELFVAYRSIFTGMAITSNVNQLSVKALTTIKEPIAVCLSKNGVVIPNMLLDASFVNGDGELTPPSKTDYTGTAVFYLTNIISKDDVQSISVTISDSVLNELSGAYKSLINKSELPVKKIMVTVSDPVHLAYFSVETNDIPECERQVRSIFANNYFEINEDPNSELYIVYSTAFTVGNEVDGEMYKLNECFCSLSVKIYNNATWALLGEYATPEVRVLVPIDKSVEQTTQMCARELMKRYKAGLPAVLKRIKF